LSFASERWVKVARRPASEGPPTNRRYLEVCVFSYLASELRSGDMCVQGSESFADYRKQLLPWEECLQRLPAYCEKVGLPGTAKEFVGSLKTQLEEERKASPTPSIMDDTASLTPTTHHPHEEGL